MINWLKRNKPCELCGEIANHPQEKTARYCSRRCCRLANPIIKPSVKGVPWSEARREAQKYVVRTETKTRTYTQVGKYLYPLEWAELRKKIYERDRWTCQECGVHCKGKKYKDAKARIQCHHIDYNIENCEENNLITLCQSCHGKTNFNRSDWQEYFQSIERN